MVEVRATARGYYGGIIRDDGDVFAIAAPADLGSWMAPVGSKPADPLDHDGDGKKGGSKPADQPTGRDAVKAQASALGIEFPANIKTEKLKELVDNKIAETAAAGDGELSDDDKILKALEISGRSDEMTVAEAEAIIAAAAAGGADDI